MRPQLDITGENIASHEVFYPMPSRFEDDAGMTNGYKNEVVLPLAIAPADMARPVKLSMKAFFGVCDVVCIPQPNSKMPQLSTQPSAMHPTSP